MKGTVHAAQEGAPKGGAGIALALKEGPLSDPLHHTYCAQLSWHDTHLVAQICRPTGQFTPHQHDFSGLIRGEIWANSMGERVERVACDFTAHALMGYEHQVRLIRVPGKMALLRRWTAAHQEEWGDGYYPLFLRLLAAHPSKLSWELHAEGSGALSEMARELNSARRTCTSDAGANEYELKSQIERWMTRELEQLSTASAWRLTGREIRLRDVTVLKTEVRVTLRDSKGSEVKVSLKPARMTPDLSTEGVSGVSDGRRWVNVSTQRSAWNDRIPSVCCVDIERGEIREQPVAADDLRRPTLKEHQAALNVVNQTP